MKLVQIIVNEVTGTLRYYVRPGLVLLKPEERQMQFVQITERCNDVVFVWFILFGKPIP